MAISTVLAKDADGISQNQMSLVGCFQLLPLAFNLYMGITAIGINKWFSSGCSFMWNYVVVVYAIGLIILVITLVLGCCVVLVMIAVNLIASQVGKKEEEKKLIKDDKTNKTELTDNNKK